MYKLLKLDAVYSASDKKRFESMLVNPKPITPETLTEEFGKYWDNPRYYILKGLAEAFCKLDKFYKSHSNFGFGVKGLPKRAIINSFAGRGYGYDMVLDILGAMELVEPDMWLGEFVPEPERKDWKSVVYDSQFYHKGCVIPKFGVELRVFGNGNAHMYFNERALKLVNDALHEFYGNVLPDVDEKPTSKQASTEVSKDLQFYPTPAKVASVAIGHLSLAPGSKVLEPSCGEGALLEKMEAIGWDAYGVEVDGQRAQICRNKGYKVLTANFLEAEFSDGFDGVVMNPPFAGMHYLKHIEKAIECLKPGGQLVAILPATAMYSHGKLPKGGWWYDLPIGSFKESGTNVNTGCWVFTKRD